MLRLLASMLIILAMTGQAWGQGIDQVYRKAASGKSWGTMLAQFFGRSGYNESYALVIGVSSFDHFGNLPTGQDPIRMKDFLIDEAGFDYVHLLTEDKVTYARVRALMEDEFPGLLDGNDRFLFYWSGHGITRGLPGGGQRGYLPLGQSRADQFAGMVSMANIREWDRNLEAEQVLYLLDACFSGLAGTASMAVTDYQRLRIDQLAQPSRHILTAGTGDEETIAIDRLGGSVFTAAVLDGLRGDADASTVFPNDGLVSVNELKHYVNERVLRERTQAGWQRSITPQLRDLATSNGEFFFITARRLAEVLDTPPAFSADQRTILEAQEILAGLGYEPGPRDGILGLRTLGAIRRFQSETGLSATEALDGATQAALIDAWAGKSQAIVMGTATAPAPPTSSGGVSLVTPGQTLLTPFEQDPSYKPGDRFRDCDECPEMVVVPAAPEGFMIGWPKAKNIWAAQGPPPHLVTIVKPFAVGIHEVTRGQFAAFVEATEHDAGNQCRTHENGSWGVREARSWRSPGFSQSDHHPVVCVSWDDAQAYVAWLAGETQADYRLLSEAEWEYVARAGTTTYHWFGEKITPKDANFGGNIGKTLEVGFFEKPNGFGLHDVHGNAWEWVEDCWNESYAGAPADGSAWKRGDCARRINRGGGWEDLAGYLGSAYRGKLDPASRIAQVGFRVARALR